MFSTTIQQQDRPVQGGRCCLQMFTLFTRFTLKVVASLQQWCCLLEKFQGLKRKQ
jgi:hypothetical protein